MNAKGILLDITNGFTIMRFSLLDQRKMLLSRFISANRKNLSHLSIICSLLIIHCAKMGNI